MRAPDATIRFAKRLRSELSPPEVRLWLRLRALRGQGIRIRRQHPIGRYVLDFYCPERKLAIEIDGFGHAMGGREIRDERRDAWLAREGIEVVRIPAAEVMRDPDAIAHSIYERLKPA
jgi:very-short-patch-repair endonuclease